MGLKRSTKELIRQSRLRRSRISEGKLTFQGKDFPHAEAYKKKQRGEAAQSLRAARKK